MKIDVSSSAPFFSLTPVKASGATDAFPATGGSSSPPTPSPPVATNQVRPAANDRLVVVQAEVSSQIAALQGSSSNSRSGTTATSNDVHDMTNAQLVAYGHAHGLGDIAEHFQVDYASADRSAAGEATFYQSLMSDPTKHDFVKEFEAVAAFNLRLGSVDGYKASMLKANELLQASGQDAAKTSKVS